jgi:hypothetical protein
MRFGGLRWNEVRALDARRGLVLIAVVAVAISLSCRGSSLTDHPRPWEKGQRITDPDLEQILRPDVPVVSAGLYRGTDRRVYFVAKLAGKPGDHYLEKYQKLIASRGVFARPVGSSPHAIPPRIMGSYFLAFKKGRLVPFSLFHVEFKDGDDKWLRKHPLRSFPNPFKLERDLLSIRLGFEDQPWTESILVPERDVVDVKELPFPRFPGAVLQWTGPEKSDGQLLDDPSVYRNYVVPTVPMSDVIKHYVGVLRAYGVPLEPESPNERGRISWGGSFKHIERIAVEPSGAAQGLHGALGRDELREKVPNLMEGSPKVLAFSVRVGFTSSEDAAAYFTEQERLRREQLLAQRNVKQPK